jgi:competence protein ComEA
VYNVGVGRRFTMAPRAPNLSITTVGLAVLVLVAGALWFGLGTSDAAPPRPDVALPVADSAMLIVVHVSGAVRAPGVVSVTAASRVFDVVVAAGGATSSADLTQINLAAPVRDGDRVIVPFEGERAAGVAGDEGVDLNAATSSGLEELPGVGPVLAARIVAFREANGAFTAVEDLLDVPGIGEAKLAAMRGTISAP